MKVKALISKVNSKSDGWEEILEVTSLKTAEAEVKEIIDEFNRTETARYGNEARSRFRKLVKVIGEYVPSPPKPEVKDYHKSAIETLLNPFETYKDENSEDEEDETDEDED
jgi:hypothetical protein